LTGFYSVLRHLSEGEGSTKGALTCEQLNQFRLPLPPLDEQVHLVQAYKVRTQAIEELLVHAREHIERLREYRSSLISAAVTGQLDVGVRAEAARLAA
jgi:type I restriction enzyme, S subunit